ncbi:MAG: SDR family NAD(P)-dependent oxidoreductase [Planctomycetota bacterium]|nr:MAG: SDR family NAD(P)-dependent oxidoreductase [Planctomycetota bacterium]REK28875.1 MAG: SDR family NAD(P)-dependent oxidoreductase [Planctomycetota bacterium]REK39691.1 MAG: SDR family NAD(P)-dependent oxidoreductase [Planctomycetota bacterium]
MELAGKSVVVTGGAVRIGRALAIRLARAGVNVCLHCNSSTKDADATVNVLRDLGVRATTVSADFSNPVAAARALLERAVEELGAVDFLINSAAIFEPATLAELTEAGWDRHLGINLKAPVFLCQQFCESLPEGRRGQVINIADWRGTRPVPGHLAYTVAKAGLVATTRLLAQELAPHVQVNAIAPGAILPATGSSVEAFEERAESIPLRRTGGPNDIADAVEYLLRSDFVTGEVIHVTGGEQL